MNKVKVNLNEILKPYYFMAVLSLSAFTLFILGLVYMIEYFRKEFIIASLVVSFIAFIYEHFSKRRQRYLSLSTSLLYSITTYVLLASIIVLSLPKEAIKDSSNRPLLYSIFIPSIILISLYDNLFIFRVGI